MHNDYARSHHWLVTETLVNNQIKSGHTEQLHFRSHTQLRITHANLHVIFRHIRIRRKQAVFLRRSVLFYFTGVVSDCKSAKTRAHSSRLVRNFGLSTKLTAI